MFSDQKLGPYHLSPGCQVTYHGLWNFCVGAERWMSIKEVFYCSFGNLGHWRWPDHGIKPASGILALGALGLRYEDVFEYPPLSSSIWCYLIITQPEWNLVWFLFICIIHYSTGKPSVDFQNAEKRALWSMAGPSCISKLWFWLIKNATVHMGLCFLLRR